MKIGIYQFLPQFGEKEKNLTKIEKAIKNSNANLMVLPELCTTGYQFISQDEVDDICEPIPEGSTVNRLVKMCKDSNSYLVAGIGEKAGNRCYNSSVLVGPEGYIGKYRKVHLFFEENKWFKPGDLGFPVWDIGSAKIGMMICFDWVYPESVRSLALQGVDIVCHPVNLVLPYCQQAMVTRSIENSVFVVTANRVGSEQRGGKDKLTFTGSSQITAPRGDVLFRMGKCDEFYQDVEIDPSQARDKKLTLYNDLLKDRRPDQYY
jgi:predicted amidohydrolase